MIARPPQKKPPTDWGRIAALAFGWVFVIGAAFLLYYIIQNAPRERRLVCDRSARAQLNKFGTCRYE